MRTQMRPSWRYGAAWVVLLLAGWPMAAETATNGSPSVPAGEIRLTGRVRQVDSKAGAVLMDATSFTLPSGRSGRISPPKKKCVVGLPPEQLRALKAGDRVQVIGIDAGPGQALTAREFNSPSVGGGQARAVPAKMPESAAATLIKDCSAGDVGGVRTVLLRYPQLARSVRQSDRSGLLQLVAGWHSITRKSDYLEIARELLAKGADPNVTDRNGNSPLHSASYAEMVRLLLAHGADARAINQLGETTLRGEAEAIRLKLAAGADPKRLPSPIPRAADGDGVRLLLQAGADPFVLAPPNPRMMDPGGETLLHTACDATAVRALIAAGSKLEARDKLGRTPLALQCFQGDRAADRVRALLEAGADPNARMDNGMTILHLIRSTANARLLLERGADPNAVNRAGVSVIEEAVLNGGAPLIRVLAEFKANVNVQDRFSGYTPLLRLASEKNPSPDKGQDERAAGVAEALVAAGADVNAKGRYQRNTCLHNAAGANYLQLAEKLVDLGADVNARMQDGSTPLAVALKNGHVAMAQLLRARGGMP